MFNYVAPILFMTEGNLFRRTVPTLHLKYNSESSLFLTDLLAQEAYSEHKSAL